MAGGIILGAGDAMPMPNSSIATVETYAFCARIRLGRIIRDIRRKIAGLWRGFLLLLATKE
jgi:hypothetical protein